MSKENDWTGTPEDHDCLSVEETLAKDSPVDNWGDEPYEFKEELPARPLPDEGGEVGSLVVESANPHRALPPEGTKFLTRRERRAAERKQRRKKLWLVGITAVLTVALLASLFIFGKYFMGPEPAIPLKEGALIVVPDNIDGGLSNEVKAELMKDRVEDDSAPVYEEPQDLHTYRHVDDDGNVVLKAPVDGPCRIDSRGNIEPPNNYLHVCYYEKNGAVFYTSHAVLGKRVGALENIQHLEVGQEVVLDNEIYAVSEVKVFPQFNLPEYLFKPGVVALVTCHIDSSVKNWSDFTKTDIVILEKKQ